MERVRSAFNNMVRSERYSRFSLQPGGARDADEQHVEVKLSDDPLDDAAEANGQPAGGSPSYQPQRPASARHRRQRRVCYAAGGGLLFFLIGYLIGYLSHHKPEQQKPISCAPAGTVHPPADANAGPPEYPEPSLKWSDITRLLSEKLNTQILTQALRDLDVVSRSSGSDEDTALVNRIDQQFKLQQMTPWKAIHHVQLQTQNSSKPNAVRFGSEVFWPKGYLAYSPDRPSPVQGKVVYGNYGTLEDFRVLLNKSIELNGSVVLLRASTQSSFAQQVSDAASMGASAVLLYPDPQDYKFNDDTELYGHVHLGSGDPYTPGFPSFKLTQFPPTKSSGLPSIPAQTITAKMAATILRDIGGPEVEANSSFIGRLSGATYRLGGSANATVEVNNVLASRELYSVFGVIKGFVDPDRYVVIGAQRDSWCRGYARSTVGTAILMELSKAIHEMVEKDGFLPRRSIVFASWSAGEYGNVGITEWLEGYLSSLDKKVFTYISLDGVVMGKGSFVASASPLLHGLIERTIRNLASPTESGTVFDTLRGEPWLRPMAMQDPAYPFLAFSGIPSLSFHIVTKGVEAYRYYGTCLDDKNHLDYATGHKTPETAVAAATLAGQIALRLVHDYRLPLDVSQYGTAISEPVNQLFNRINALTQSGQLSSVRSSWISSTRSSYRRAAAALTADIANTDLTNDAACRVLDGRIMAVEHCLLSPYVAPQDTPFRHLLVGRGAHTLASLLETSDMEHFQVQLALATWTLQGCADSMAGQIWEVDNEI